MLQASSRKGSRSRNDIRDVFQDLRGQDRLEEALIERRFVSRKAMEAARMERAVTGERIGSILVRNGLLSQKLLIETILEIAPDEISSERVARSRIPVQILRRWSILLAAETDSTLYVSTNRRERDVEPIVRQYYPEKDIRFVTFHANQMSDFIIRMQGMAGSDESGEIAQDERLEYLLYQAHDLGASDIHILPKGRTYTVMFRLLGERQLIHEGPVEEYQAVRAQIKNQAGMDVAEDRVPQDGVFQMDFAGKLVDFRTVTVPAVFGEYIVMRLLDPDAVRLSLDAMGISRVDHWRRGFNQINGLCIICGPTGSGKTTTLNATMRELDRFGKAIFTVEDPIEYPLIYAGQVSVNPAVGMDYNRALRAFMRADPDVINIGEVRDHDTAITMMRAAETGHMVLATLHASTIRDTIGRLERLGLATHDLRYVVRAILVQNLIRTICPNCDGAGEGCEKCKHSGYAGRTIVSECQSFYDEAEFDRMAKGEIFWPRLIEDAADRLEEGRTDLRELRRVYGTQIENEMERRAQKGVRVPVSGATASAGEKDAGDAPGEVPGEGEAAGGDLPAAGTEPSSSGSGEEIRVNEEDPAAGEDSGNGEGPPHRG